jgi:hypothetical protein
MFEKARMRIKNINWDYEGVDKPSYFVLITEFLRRETLFLDFN